MRLLGGKVAVFRSCVLIALMALVAGACSAESVVTVEAPAAAAADQAAEPQAADSAATDPTVAAVEPTAAVLPTAEASEATEDAAAGTESSSTTDDDTDADSDTDADADTELKPEAVDSLLGTSPAGTDLDAGEVLCIAAALSDDDTLSTLVTNDADFESLTIDQQADVMVAAFDCAPDTIAEEFSSFAGDDGELPPEVGECFVEAMSSASPDRRDVIIGFAALGAERPVPEDSRDPMVDTMVRCIDGNALSGLLTDELLSDPALAPAVDIDCVGENFGGEALRPMWEALVDNPGSEFDELDAQEMGPVIDAIFGCISFGQVLAAEAAADGVVFSDETIDCIDQAMADIDIANLLETGEGAEQMGGALLGCLSPEELQAMGG